MGLLDVFGSDALREEERSDSGDNDKKLSYCSKCGKKLIAGAKFCGNCGHSVFKKEERNDVKQEVKKKPKSVKREDTPHPWRRYFARMIDTWILGIGIGLLLGTAAPEFLEETPELVLTILIMLLVLPYDAFCLSTWKKTAGKWMMGIEVVKTDGSLLSVEEAFKRSWLILLRGLGLGIPIIALFTLIHQFNMLKGKGIVSWDKEIGSMIEYEKLRTERVILAVILTIGFIVLMAIGSEM